MTGPDARPELESGMGASEGPDSSPPRVDDAGPDAALEERLEVEQAMLEDTVAPGLAHPQAREPDEDTPVFQEPGGPPTTPTV